MSERKREYSGKLVDRDHYEKIDFGLYKGTRYDQLETSYIRFVLAQDWIKYKKFNQARAKMQAVMAKRFREHGIASEIKHKTGVDKEVYRILKKAVDRYCEEESSNDTLKLREWFYDVVCCV